jgi:hypothetical protein
MSDTMTKHLTADDLAQRWSKSKYVDDISALML